MRFSELVDLDQLQLLYQSLAEALDMATAILDLEGNLLTVTGQYEPPRSREICARFHRVHPLTAERCRESDSVLACACQEAGYKFYRCKNGLMDGVAPIMVAGEHVANLIFGQFFFEPPDEEYFIRQARQFGFGEPEYLHALAKVPVYPERKVYAVMDFLSRLAGLMGQMGLARKRLEDVNEQLRRYQEHLEELVQERTRDLNRAQQIAHLGNWRWDFNADVVIWSDEAYRVLGLQPGEPAQPNYETFQARIHPADRRAVLASVNEAIRTKRPFNFEFRTIPIDDRETIVRVFGEVRCAPSGEPVELFGVHQDITEERRGQQALAEAKERAEAANRAKSVFLANMSHELRSPLNAILGFSHLMQAERDMPPMQWENLDIIIRSGEHLLNLINNVLDISKIEAGRVAREEVSFDLQQLLQTVGSLMRGQAAQKGLSLVVEHAADLPCHIRADAGKLRQVLINLLGNAIKYTQHGGVLLHVRRAEQTSPQQTRLRFDVVDSGIGIPREEQTRLFGPFVQLTNRPLEEVGSGLGLAICREFVDLMGGQIGVTSQPDKGSTFYFEIPVALTPADQGSAGPVCGRITGLAPDQPHYRLLIAEDQPENRLLLHRLLESWGFEVRDAINGQEAVTLCEQWQPQLVWMDIRMPVMNGAEACRRIKANRPDAAPKIIALTAHALEEESREILAAGCDGFIRKPYRDREIHDALIEQLRVQFVYAGEDTQPAPATRGEDRKLEARQLAKLPSVLIEELSKAAELLDMHRSLEVIGQINDIDPVLGEQLHRLVTNLQYKGLLAALDDLKGRPHEYMRG